MRNLLLLVGTLLAVVGCQSGSDAVDSSTHASAPAIKSPSELPSSMPAQTRKQAASAMGAAAATQAEANDPARVKAMEEMKKQHGG